MGILKIVSKQIYRGVKSVLGHGTSAKKASEAAAKAKTAYSGPTMLDLIKKQPKALPRPTAQQLAADKPSVFVPKVTHLNADELRMSQEILKDGTHVRYFRDPESDKVLIKTKDKGILHQEWINPGDKNNFIYIKKAGNDRYILKKSGDYTQIEQSTVKYKDGINQKISTNDLYYTDYIGTRARLHKSKGFNGTSEQYYTHKGYTTDKCGQSLNYELYATKNLRTISNEPFVRGLCQKLGYNKADKLLSSAERLFNVVKAKFTDFEDALFAPFKE